MSSGIVEAKTAIKEVKDKSSLQERCKAQVCVQ